MSDLGDLDYPSRPGLGFDILGVGSAVGGVGNAVAAYIQGKQNKDMIKAQNRADKMAAERQSKLVENLITGAVVIGVLGIGFLLVKGAINSRKQ